MKEEIFRIDIKKCPQQGGLRGRKYHNHYPLNPLDKYFAFSFRIFKAFAIHSVEAQWKAHSIWILCSQVLIFYGAQRYLKWT